MYRQLSTSSEPKIIGVNNGIFQVEIVESSLRENKNFEEINSILNQTNIFGFIDDQYKIFDLQIDQLRGRILKGANITDVMGFSPFYFGFKFIVSQKFLDCLNKIKVDINEYYFLNIKLSNIDENYYLFFTPVIPTSEILFDKSKIFLEKDFLEKDRKILKIDHLGEYQEFTMKNPFVYFEKICLDNQYENKDIINVQASNNIFFSQRLIDEFNKIGLTNLIEPSRQTELIFSS